MQRRHVATPSVPARLRDIMAAVRESVGAIRFGMRQTGAVGVGSTMVVLALALFLARYSREAPLLVLAENALYDARAWVTTPVTAQDPRIVLVVFNEDTMRRTQRRSPVDRAVLAAALRQLDQMGPRAIGLDLLLDQAQPEDPELADALRGMKTPTHLGFAGAALNPDDIQDWQERFETRFLGQAEAANSRVTRASVRMVADRDGVIRRWPVTAAGEPPPLALSMVYPNARISRASAIRWRRASPSIFTSPADAPLFLTLPIHDVAQPDTASFLSRFVRGRYVLVGVQLSDADAKRIPSTLLTGATSPGLQIHAAMLAQALDHVGFSPIPGWTLDVGAILVVIAGAASGLLRVAPGPAIVWLGVQGLIIAFWPLAFAASGVDTTELPQLGWAMGWLTAYLATSTAARSVGAEQRRFAQMALGRYLPTAVANEILLDPSKLEMKGERRAIHALFTDLAGFTPMTHTHSPETLAPLLNEYLDSISRTILEYGGTISGFAGDGVVAFWGAPIQRPGDGDRAARAAVQIWRHGEQFRSPGDSGRPALGATRIGVDFGDAIVGNFGGEARIQYTALGDVMNTASRLEGANKHLATRLLFSRAATPPSLMSRCRAMGRIQLRGRETPIEVFEPAIDFPEEACERLNRAWTHFDAGNLGALDDIRALASEFPEDRAIACLVARLEAVGPGGAYRVP